MTENHVYLDMPEHLIEILGVLQDEIRKNNSSASLVLAPGGLIDGLATAWRSFTSMNFSLSESSDNSPDLDLVIAGRSLGEIFDSADSNVRHLVTFAREPIQQNLDDARRAWKILVDELLTVLASYNHSYVDVFPQAENESKQASDSADLLKSLKLAGQIGWSEIAIGFHADRAKEAEKNAKESAGAAASNALTQHYEKYSKSQANAAKWFRITTICVVALAIALPFTLHLLGAREASLTAVIGNLVLSAGLFGLSGYFARQAHLHRTLSTWAESIKIQLLTFDGFISPVQNLDKKDDLRAAFANRVFGPQPKFKGEPGVTASAPIIDSIITKLPR